MRRKLMLVVLMLGVVGLVACNKDVKQKDVKEEKVNTSIDISEIDEDKIQFSSGSLDMNVYNPSVEELSEEADVIFKGKLVGIDSYLDDWEMKSNYTFEVDEYYKGDVEESTFTINTLGGIMKEKEYKELISKVWEIDDEKWVPDDDMYVVHGLMGMEPLDLNSEYFVYAYYYNDSYHPMYTIYGTYKKNENGEYERFGIDEGDRHTKTLEELENSVKE